MFFGSLNHFLFGYTKKAISLLVDLISKTKTANLLQFAFHQLESRYLLAEIYFDNPNSFNSLIPSRKNNDSEHLNNAQTLIFTHQRILIAFASRFVNNGSLNEIKLCSRDDEAKILLDFLNEYTISLLKKFHEALENCASNVEIDQSFILLVM